MSARLNKQNLNTIINRAQRKMLERKLISQSPRIGTSQRRYTPLLGDLSGDISVSLRWIAL